MLLDRSTGSTFNPELGDVHLPSFTYHPELDSPWIRITTRRIMQCGMLDGFFFEVVVTKLPFVDEIDAKQHRFFVAAAPAGRVGRPDDLKVIQILAPSGPWAEQKLSGVDTDSLNKWLFGSSVKPPSRRDRTRPLEELKEAIASRLDRHSGNLA